jgi:hypothetical protein
MWFLMDSSPRFISSDQMGVVSNSRIRSHGPLSHNTYFSVMVAHASGFFLVLAMAKGYIHVFHSTVE